MNPEARARVESLCVEALSKDAQERAAFLDEACGSDAELRREVDSLLAGRADADGLLQTPSSIASTPPLPAGTHLGPYEIQSFIGAGGMGQVYKARDTRLGRTVAIKTLPPDLAAHPERRRRFEQEARAASALNDPHICTLHDIGSASVAGVGSALPFDSAQGREGGTTPATIDYLVMEYLDGETLAARLRKGRLPVRQALEYATQIADALSKAHRQGIVHRDLKPGNVMLTKSGAKLLDFGLAKLRVASAVAGVMSSSPTREKSSLTAEGTLLGTVPYMAPEQLEGKEADARSDIFSFGTMLYEMITGKRAFEGESHASVIAAILEHEPPPLSSLQPVTPPALDHLVRQCLAKSPDDRPDTAHDVGNQLRWLRESSAVIPGPPAQRRQRRVVRIAGIATAVAGAVAAGAALMWLMRPISPVAIVRSKLDVKPADNLNAGGTVAVRLPTPGGSRTALTWTPDGQTLIFVGRQGADKEPYKALNAQRLYVRHLRDSEARPLKGTEGAHAPAVSPDGQWVAFWAPGPNGAEGAIRKVPLGGGPVRELLKTDAPWGLVFDDRGDLFFGRFEDFRIWQIHEGTASPVTKTEGAMFDILPWPLPGGRVVLYTKRWRGQSWGDERVVAKTLATGEVKVLLENAADARYVPTGHLVFMRQGRLFAVRFDPDRIEKLGEEVPVVDDVVQALTSGGNSRDITGAGQFAVASTGTLAYVEGGVVAPDPRRTVVMLDRMGKVTPLPCPPRSYAPALRFSSSGGSRRLAVIIDGLTEKGLWVCDIDSGLLTSVVKEGEVVNAPLWLPDGLQLAFTWLTDGKLWLATVPSDTGLTASPRKRVENVLLLGSPAEGGREVAATFGTTGKTAIINLEDGRARDLPPEEVLQPEFSPDGRWLAYLKPVTDGLLTSGERPIRSEVYVRPYPGPGQTLPVSTEGGLSPAWNPNGRELFFAVDRGAGELWLMAADFEPGPPPRVRRPHKLFQVYRADIFLSGARGAMRLYDVASDGRHFFAVKNPPPLPLPVVTHVNLIMNWFDELKAKAPRK